MPGAGPAGQIVAALFGGRCHQARGVEEPKPGGHRQLLLLSRQGDLAAVADGGQRQGAGHRHPRLEVLLHLVVVDEAVQKDQEARTVGLLELADHEAADAGSGAPVDVAAVVAGHVVAQGVE